MNDPLVTNKSSPSPALNSGVSSDQAEETSWTQLPMLDNKEVIFDPPIIIDDISDQEDLSTTNTDTLHVTDQREKDPFADLPVIGNRQVMFDPPPIED